MATVGNVSGLFYAKFCKLCMDEGVSVSGKVNMMIFEALLEKGIVEESWRPILKKSKKGRKTNTQKFQEWGIPDHRIEVDDDDFVNDEVILFDDDE